MLFGVSGLYYYYYYTTTTELDVVSGQVRRVRHHGPGWWMRSEASPSPQEEQGGTRCVLEGGTASGE